MGKRNNTTNNGIALALTTAAGSFSLRFERESAHGERAAVADCDARSSRTARPGSDDHRRQHYNLPPGSTAQVLKYRHSRRGDSEFCDSTGTTGPTRGRRGVGAGLQTLKEYSIALLRMSPTTLFTLNGSSYVALTAVKPGDPAPDTNPNWSLMAQKGQPAAASGAAGSGFCLPFYPGRSLGIYGGQHRAGLTDYGYAQSQRR